MDFEKRKAATLASLGSTETDKSPKGTVDTPIIPLLNLLNSHPSYFTTSSCSGRVSILSQPIATVATTNPKKKAQGGSWLFITHEPADSDSVLDLLFRYESNHVPPSELVLRFEPLIVAVECKDLASAQALVSSAISVGFRESGITSANKRVIIAIRCSIRLEVPLGNTHKIMVSPEYVRYLIDVANEKMEANRKRSDRFLKALQENNFAAAQISEDFDRMHLKAAVEDGNGITGFEERELVCDHGEDGSVELEKGGGNVHFGLVDTLARGLSVDHLEIIGEPMGKLFLWGHSACAMNTAIQSKIIVFGGFGGMGRHERRNDVLLLDPLIGALQAINREDGPATRLGHTASLVGEYMFLIGGRADPVKILGDVWVLNIKTKEWTFLECSGSFFPPRHRHASTVVGSDIYVFGGLDNETILPSLYVFNTSNQTWKELLASGEQPCARHSHSMVACGSHIFMFGGYNGDKVLGDLYSFDVQACQWKEVKTNGRNPHSRFSHSMFVYKNYLGIIGGCPVRQHSQELALLDLQSYIWKHVTLDSTDKYLFVRSTATVLGDHLVMIGGGASCYAFGTKFSEPVKIDLKPLQSSHANLKTLENGREKISENLQNGVILSSIEAPALNIKTEVNGASKVDQNIGSHWVLQLERKYAKLGKDILKKFGWLDLGRKVYSKEGGIHICFPVNDNFCHLFEENEGNNDLQLLKPFAEEGVLLNEVSCSRSLNILKERGAIKLEGEVVEIRIATKSPSEKMSEAVASLIKHKGLSVELLEEIPTRWERLGDIVVLPITSFKNPTWDTIGEELWPSIAKSLNTHRLARQGRVAPTGTRDSTLEILVGDNGWVDHRENGILYSFDATKCMFSWGNRSEKLRMGLMDCRDEIIVDLFAGIGYFVLPFLVSAQAKLVYACEWNPHAIEALQRNLQANCVRDRCIVLEGDNRNTAPKGVADRVCLGLIPTSEGSWVTAVRALRSEGGVLHVHGNAKDSEEGLWTEHVLKSINEIATSEGRSWDVLIEHVERVKSYAPHIRHLVADVRCRKTEENS